MKKLFLGLFLTGAFAAVSAQSIAFDKTTLEYGDIAQNSNGERFFTITNTGDKPLILTNVKLLAGVRLHNGARILSFRGKVQS